MNVSTLVDEAAVRYSDRISLELAGAPRTVAEVARLTHGGAATLVATGGRHVVYLAVAGPAFPLAMLSAARAGLPFTPVNYRLAPDQIVELVARFDDPVVIADPEFSSIVDGKVLTVESFLDRTLTAPATSFADASPRAAAVVLFTSGTTSRPKAVILRHVILHAYLSRVASMLVTEPGDTSLVAVPPYHVTGVAGVLGSFTVGRRMVFLPTFTAEGWLALARAERVTSGTLVPTMVARIVRYLDGAPGDVPTLKALAYGGSRMPRSVVEKALAAFPTTDFVNGYGLTETSAGITALSPEEHRAALASDDPAVSARLGSAGRPAAGVEVQIRGAGGLLGPGEVGELWVRGPQIAGEYVEAGSVLDADGWFPTRDLAYLDADGYLLCRAGPTTPSSAAARTSPRPRSRTCWTCTRTCTPWPWWACPTRSGASGSRRSWWPGRARRPRT